MPTAPTTPRLRASLPGDDVGAVGLMTARLSARTGRGGASATLEEMADDENPRELDEWEPYDARDDAATSPWERRRRVMRIVALVTMIAMVVPGALTTWAIAQSTAERSCRIAVDYYANDRTPSRVAFELGSPDTLGWNCYALAPTGEVRVALLGLIPGPPRLVPTTRA